MITKKQKEVFDFVKTYLKKGYAPSLKEIQKKFKLASVSTAHFYITKLKKAGYLERSENTARGISVPKKELLVKIPLLGVIAAGEPIEAIRQNEFIAIAKTKLPNNGDFYALRVSGNSMIDENIKDGDIILVKQQEVAENGQRVVALIDNYEATLKKFYKEHDQIRLQPANSAYEPIIIKKDREVQIQGIVIDVIQNEPSEIEDITTTLLKRNKILPLNKIILGDAIAQLKKLPDESCDVIIIDPPYNIGKDFGNNIDKRELKEYVSWCKEWINESIRIMKPSGTMFIYGFSEILAYLSVEIPIQKRWLIWHYTNKNVASSNFWQRSHESIICAWKDKPVFNRDEIREPYTEGFLNGAAGKVRKGTVGRYSNSGKETIYHAHEGGALPRDVIKIPALAGGAGMNERWFLCKTCNKICEPRQLKEHEKHEIIKHPTQKPFELSKKLIKSAMPKSDGVVLVPFVGTGSECAAAKELDQSYIGFEINPDYVRLAEKMIDDKRPVAKLF
ncbi:MAG: repressor LexA [Candidatus Taylorbacteria bacterium RIFOXYD2_FULL_36_9]|uniref:LexA repressor n=1 Tax=Candidatus Taylorbacteria bacterium RIFOXYD2_FULL_36_9 TaxID=1802338 RepID=A0A1G2PDR5_9BACT|nr:MAG: repressor LexA [Candidatus Taylorbacteria bacterium RIFOXYD2_FULL_36_9]